VTVLAINATRDPEQSPLVRRLLGNLLALLQQCAGICVSMTVCMPEASPAHLPSSGVFEGSYAPSLVPLVPRWRYVSDKGKALTQRTAVSALVVLLVQLVFRALVGVVAWWIWKACRR
jgi:hypothetical protein